MNGNSLQGAGGIGKAVADWIVEGIPIQELLPFEVNRFVDLHNNRQYLQQRVVEIVERYDAMQCKCNVCLILVLDEVVWLVQPITQPQS